MGNKRTTLRSLVEAATGQAFHATYQIKVDQSSGRCVDVDTDEIDIVFDSGSHPTGDYETARTLVLEHQKENLLIALYLSTNSMTNLDGQYEPELTSLSELRQWITDGKLGLNVQYEGDMDAEEAREHDRGRIAFGEWLAKNAARLESGPSGWLGDKPRQFLPTYWPAWRPGAERLASSSSKGKKAARAAERAARKAQRSGRLGSP